MFIFLISEIVIVDIQNNCFGYLKYIHVFSKYIAALSTQVFYIYAENFVDRKNKRDMLRSRTVA